jgi:hypothetical protein
MLVMRSVFLSLVLGVVGLGLAPARAQEWNGGPVISGNYLRAYRHFLNSPYSYRTFSGSSPGYWTERYTPYGYRSFYVEPGYVHQRITPYGFEGFDWVPGYEAYTTTPFGPSYHYVPGYGYPYHAPHRFGP